MPKRMPAETPSLDDLRREIDEIDSAIHDLIMRRAEVGRAIGAIKGGDGIAIRPGREARILRRLVARHRGPLPRAVVVRIWREIIAAFTALQGPFSVAVSAVEGGPDLRELARDHYGSQTPVRSLESDQSVLRAVSEGEATVGVLPLPRSEEQNPWWRNLARDGDNVPRIVARLPFTAGNVDRPGGADGFAVSLAAPEASGEDRGLLILETPDPMSRGSLKALMAKAEFEALDIQNWAEAPERRLHLIEVEGFLDDDDPRIGALLEAGADVLSHCWWVGGYAVPLSATQLADASGEDAA